MHTVDADRVAEWAACGRVLPLWDNADYVLGRTSMTIYDVKTNANRTFWVVATSPGRAITKLKRKGKKLLDYGEKIIGVEEAGTVDVK